jgi:hypothetical protein
LTLAMKVFQVLADGNERSTELLGKIANQDAALILKEFQDQTSAFFVQHGERGRFRFLSKRFGLFRY